ncbi:MAG: DUF1501 domain-containing protein [Pirellulales bacterium]
MLNSCAPRDTARFKSVRRRGRAKHVIFLYMDGGPSQMDTFDPKPRLARDDGKQIDLKIQPRFATQTILKSPYKFRKCGESGCDVSEIFPEVAQCADRLAVIRSMVAEHFEHPTANYFMQTGSALRGRPSLGSWVHYGLGDSSKELPGYVVLHANRMPLGGSSMFANAFLPARHQPTFLDNGQEPIQYLARGEPSAKIQQEKFALVQRWNRRAAQAAPREHELDALVATYEMAYRMQTSVPELLDLSGESAATHTLYGLDSPATEEFGRQCLMARRLVERGVGFVLLLPPTTPGADRWDQHENLAHDLRENARLVDRPIAGLLRDLECLGLLDETIVIWGGEFGRTPTYEARPGKIVGRDHNPNGFSMWLAGGGIRGGVQYGATDEFGYRAVENPVTVHDLHATILHLLGIDHTELTYRYGGRDFRLTDVFGDVVTDLLV